MWTLRLRKSQMSSVQPETHSPGDTQTSRHWYSCQVNSINLILSTELKLIQQPGTKNSSSNPSSLKKKTSAGVSTPPAKTGNSTPPKPPETKSTAENVISKCVSSIKYHGIKAKHAHNTIVNAIRVLRKVMNGLRVIRKIARIGVVGRIFRRGSIAFIWLVSFFLKMRAECDADGDDGVGSICSHEFCWECLADWDEIRVYGRGRHKEGCFFQTSEVGPMGLRGENIEQALRSIEWECLMGMKSYEVMIGG